MANVTDLYIDRLYEMSQMELPAATISEARKCLMDFLACTFAGAATLREEQDNFLNAFPASAEATVIGMGRKANLYNAALVNAFNSHVVELDDGHRFCMAHLEAPILPAVLAAAEIEGINGKQLLQAICVGYEAAVRVGCAIQPGHRGRGFHVTGTAGTIGAAMGVAAVLGCNAEQMKGALAAAVTSMAGVLEIQEDGSQLKPYNAAKAAITGLAAGYQSRTGFCGPDDILCGKRGLLCLTEKVDDSCLTAPLSAPFQIEGIYRKPYASCRHTHAPIDAALRIRERAYTAQELDEILVYTHKMAINGHDHVRIQGATSAKMSIPFSVAVCIATGKAGMDEFTATYTENAEILALTELVKVVEDPDLTALVPNKRAARVVLRFKDGSEKQMQIDYPKGEPENPLSDADMEEKFYSLAVFGGKTPDQADKIIAVVRDVENCLHQLWDLVI